jgi:hypothetical protein
VLDVLYSLVQQDPLVSNFNVYRTNRSTAEFKMGKREITIDFRIKGVDQAVLTVYAVGKEPPFSAAYVWVDLRNDNTVLKILELVGSIYATEEIVAEAFLVNRNFPLHNSGRLEELIDAQKVLHRTGIASHKFEL